MNTLHHKETTMLKLTGVSKVHVAGEVQTTALDRIDLDIAAGEYVAITGPSGCGKSTLLSVLGLLDVPTEGEYWFEGQNVAGWSETRLNELRRGRVGFIFQSFNLIEELSVHENVELALEYTGTPAAERRRRVTEILERLGVAHRAKHRPSQLSGGHQRTRDRHALLVADEPTGNQDTAHGDEVLRLLRAINAEGTTVVMVTHSPAHAAQASRTLHLLDGRVVVDALQAA